MLRLLVCMLAGFLFLCNNTETIRELSCRTPALTISVHASPARENPAVINGKITVKNRSSDFALYGNYNLLLGDNAGDAVPALMKTSQGNPRADNKPVHIPPGDSLFFTAYWQFNRPVDFNGDGLSLIYRKAPVTPDKPTTDADAS